MNFHCHCGWETKCDEGRAYADSPQCPICECYTTLPNENSGWSSGVWCILEQRKLYPYLQEIVEYINSLPYKMDFYVKAKVGEKFNLTKEDVNRIFTKIDHMNMDIFQRNSL